MDPVNFKNTFIQWIQRNKYICIVVLAGIVLMLFPQSNSTEAVTQSTEQPQTYDLEDELEAILSAIDGVGKVQVLLTVSEGAQTHYVTDEDSDQSDSVTSKRTETVLITDSQRTEQGLVAQVLPPVYLGAVIVCQGGDDPAVRLRVVTAVANATGLTTNKITVCKMK